MPWVVQKDFIQHLVGVAMAIELEWRFKGETKCIDELVNTPKNIGNRLWDANKASVNVSDGTGWFDETKPDQMLKYNLQDDPDPVYEYDPIRVYHYCIMFECQANSTNAWPDSEAKAIIDSLKSEMSFNIITDLDDYKKLL